jgi:taurine transport system permease protein
VSVFVDIAPDESTIDSPASVAPSSKWRGRLTRAALPVLSVIVFFVVWQLVAASGIWNQTFVPYPSAVWRAFLDVSTTHDDVRGYAGYLLAEHLYMTLRRAFAGVVIGVALGVLLGLVMGSVSWVRSILEPWLTFLRALPPLAYFFLLVIWLGIDEAPKITLLALAALPPAAVATTAAVVAAPVGLQEAARALGATKSQVIRDVVVAIGIAGDVHRHPAGGRNGLLVGGRRRIVQRAARYRRARQGRKQLQQHPRRKDAIYTKGLPGAITQ